MLEMGARSAPAPANPDQPATFQAVFVATPLHSRMCGGAQNAGDEIHETVSTAFLETHDMLWEGRRLR
jgi:hypothetical protein